MTEIIFPGWRWDAVPAGLCVCALFCLIAAVDHRLQSRAKASQEQQEQDHSA